MLIFFNSEFGFDLNCTICELVRIQVVGVRVLYLQSKYTSEHTIFAHALLLTFKI